MKSLNNLYNKILFNHKKVEVGCDLTINGRLLIRGRGKIVIGDSVRINSGMFYNPIGGDERTIFMTQKSGNIILGNGVAISNCAIVSADCIIIEDDVMLGGGCKIYDTDFHSINYEERIQDFDPGIKHAGIRIKKGAFLGAHVIVLKGVTIGTRSVIGAGSVVTKNIPDFEIWAGNPARFVRKIV